MPKKNSMPQKGAPKKDGSGKGHGSAGRGGCKNPQKTRKGSK